MSDAYDTPYTFGLPPSAYVSLWWMRRLRAMRRLVEDVRAGKAVGFYDLSAERDLTPEETCQP